MVTTILLPSTLGNYFGLSGTEKYLKEKGLVAETIVPGNSLFAYEDEIKNRLSIAQDGTYNMVPHSNAAYPATVAARKFKGKKTGKIAYIEASDSEEGLGEKMLMGSVNLLKSISPRLAQKVTDNKGLLAWQLSDMYHKIGKSDPNYGRRNEIYKRLLEPVLEITRTKGGLYLVEANKNEWDYVEALKGQGMKLGEMIEELAGQGNEILFINGSESVLRGKRNLPGSNGHSIFEIDVPKAGHIVHAEQPAVVNRELELFLSPGTLHEKIRHNGH
ncbi:MAG: hypothetical protein NTU57_04250 [Candidatus Aenigmarchaeota archaeon]|nr:hypothetical protein [Candidatus Aenigmarchaeota archaeon]